jgi:hypothetical protein
MTKSHRDVVCAVGGNPGAIAVTARARNFVPKSSIVTGENFSDGGFVTVVRKERVSPSPVNPSAIATTTNKSRIPMIGVRSYSYLCCAEKRTQEVPFCLSIFP